jgi:hypothetical protein
VGVLTGGTLKDTVSCLAPSRSLAESAGFPASCGRIPALDGHVGRPTGGHGCSHSLSRLRAVIQQVIGVVRYLSEGTPSLRDVAKVTISLAERELEASGLN